MLLALSRSFGNQLEDDLNAGVAFDQPKMRANFKNVLVTVARNFEALMLGNWLRARYRTFFTASAIVCKRNVPDGRIRASQSVRMSGSGMPTEELERPKKN